MNNHLSDQTTNSLLSNNELVAYNDEEIIQFILNWRDILQKNLGYSELYKRYFSKALTYYNAHQINEDDAKDYAQQLFLKIFDKLDTIKERTKFKSRFYLVIRNELVDQIRRQKSENTKKNNYIYSKWLGSFTQEDESFITEEKHIFVNNLIEVQKTIFSLLNKQDQRILRLKHKENYKVQEIQEVLHLGSELEIKQRIKQATGKAQEVYNHYLKTH